MARFTDEKKWSDKWFRSLKPYEKLIWIYLCDNCDIAGFYEKDIESIAFHTKINEDDIEGAIEGLSRGYIEANGYIWIKNFLKHQKNHILNSSNNCHKGIIKRIQEHLVFFPEIPQILGADQGLFSPIGKGKGKGNGNGIDKEEELNTSINPQEIKSVEMNYYHEYMKIYKSIKPYDIANIHSQSISLFRQAAQEVPEEQIVQAAKDYAMHCEESNDSIQYAKSVVSFLSEQQYRIDWLMQIKDKKGNSPEKLWQAWLDRNLKYDYWSN